MIYEFIMNGLVPATYTPLNEDFSINYAEIAVMSRYLEASGVKQIFICGSTGEGAHLTTEERKKVAEAFVKDFQGDVIVHVGHNCLIDAADLAAHAESIGAAAVSAITPSYFPMRNTETLLASMKQIADAAPATPFYYYHIPALASTGANIPALLEMAADSIPNFRGVKFTNESIFNYIACKNAADGIFDVAFGYDEMMIAGWAAGSKAFVGSTFNFMAPLYNHLIEAAEAGDMEKARELQHFSEKAIRVINEVGPFHPLVKTIITRLGVECGPARLPLPALKEGMADEVWNRLLEMGAEQYFCPKVEAVAAN